MTPTLYTFGYNGARAKQTLAELVALGTPLLDIRKNPNDGTLAWTRDMLVQERGLTYRWVEALGNDFYARHNGDIQIHDMDAGMHVLERVLSVYGRVCLLTKAKKRIETFHALRMCSDEGAARTEFESLYTSFEQSPARCVYVPADQFRHHVTALARREGEVA